MFTNKEVLKYTELIENLNEERPIPINYSVIMEGGGSGGVPDFKLLKDHDESLIIWVHGTKFSEPNYVLINILIKPVKFYFGQCHQGYLYSALSILNLINEKLLQFNINKIVCMGHSLGGAVSSVIATILKKGDFDQVKNSNALRDKFKDGVRGLVYASPPVFSPSISVGSREYITNIILNTDIVPKLGLTFDYLKKYQNSLVSFLMKRCKAVKCKGNPMKDLEDFISSCDQIDLVADRIPGKVILINQTKLTMKSTKDYQEMKSPNEFLNAAKHMLTNYYKRIKKVVEDNDEIFSNIKNTNGIHDFRLLNECDSAFLELYSSIGRSFL